MSPNFILSSFALLEWSPFALLASIEQARNLALAIGIAATTGGILLILSHKRELDQVFNSRASNARLRFENRKFRRRVAASTMITMTGILIAALYWVSDSRVFAVFVTLILFFLVGINLLAIFDFVELGIRRLATGDRDSEKRMLEEIVKKHQEAQQAKEDQESE